MKTETTTYHYLSEAEIKEYLVEQFNKGKKGNNRITVDNVELDRETAEITATIKTVK